MGLFGDILGIGYEDDIKTLAASKLDSDSVAAIPITTIATAENTRDGQREDFLKELNLAFRKEPQVFNSINLKTQMIMSTDHVLRCDNDEDGKVLKFFNEFLENLGNVGEESTEEEILEAIFKNQMKFGKYMVETVYNKNHKRIVDLALTDPLTMDFARNDLGSIIFDSVGNPVGYTQSLGPQANTDGKGDTPPNNVHLQQGQIFINPDRIAYFWLYGEKVNPLGLIEPGYKSIIRKQNIQEAQTNSIYARGTFPIIDYVGSPERFPTPKMIANATSKLSQMQHNRYFAFPYWHRIEPLEVKQPDIVDNTVQGLKEEITASLGMPLAFSMGSGEATNRSTLNTQQKLLEFSLNDVVKKSLSAFRKQIFKRISELMKYKDKDGKLIVPYYVWGDIRAEDKDAKATRLTNYLKNGGITPEFVMPFVIKSEDLVLDPELVIPSEDKNKEKEKEKDKDEEKKSKELSVNKKTIFTYQDIDEVIKEFSFKSDEKDIYKSGFSYKDVDKILEGGKDGRI